MTEQMRHRRQVQDLFDDKAPTWSAKYEPSGRLTGRLTRFGDAVSYYVPARGRVLDLGCGTGNLARHLARSGFSVQGCDISAKMLAEAKATDPSGLVDWVQLDADWQVLPFPSNVFDAIVASSVLEYVHSPIPFLAECARVLRPSAVMLATVPDVAHPVRWLEGLARPMALVPVLRAAAGRHMPRVGAYLTYLHTSRQRHPLNWWSGCAARVGLQANLPAVGASERSPLCLLTFQRAHQGQDS